MEGAGAAGAGAGGVTPGAGATGAGAAASAARKSASALSEYGSLVPRGVLRVLGGSADADGAPEPGVTAVPGIADAAAGARGSSGRDSMPRDSTEPLRIGAVWTVASGTG
jgi:hypothetical protein